jgi:copper chaperone CopZ
MTCQKCERLIREALVESVDGVISVDVYRTESFANVELDTDAWLSKQSEVKSDIIRVIQELVNGKFKAKFHDDKGKKSTKKLGKKRLVIRWGSS